MKIFYQIFIIVFVFLSLYIVKDDLKIVYNRAVTYLKDNKEGADVSLPILETDTTPQTTYPTESQTKEEPKESSTKEETKKVEQPKSVQVSKPVTPGPLRVSSNSIATNADDVQLSVKGIIAATNQNRKDNGNLPPLSENSKLDLSAQKKVNDMFAQQYFEHDSPQGVGVKDLAKGAGYDYILIGENLALGNFKTSSALVAEWMASPGHRANILNSHYKEIGVAIGRGVFEGREVWIAVQHFGVPGSACTVIDTVLEATVKAERIKVDEMAADLAVRLQRINSGAVYNGYTKNEQIDQYNALVNSYNQFITQLKQKTSDLNTQIRERNDCILSNKG